MQNVLSFRQCSAVLRDRSVFRSSVSLRDAKTTYPNELYRQFEGKCCDITKRRRKKREENENGEGEGERRRRRKKRREESEGRREEESKEVMGKWEKEEGGEGKGGGGEGGTAERGAIGDTRDIDFASQQSGLIIDFSDEVMVEVEHGEEGEGGEEEEEEEAEPSLGRCHLVGSTWSRQGLSTLNETKRRKPKKKGEEKEKGPYEWRENSI